MRSELPQQSINASSSPANSTSLSVSTNNAEIPKILLKTRILLRQVYNRQGDNIITWCEPYFPNIESTDSEINSPDINGENLANGVSCMYIVSGRRFFSFIILTDFIEIDDRWI